MTFRLADLDAVAETIRDVSARLIVPRFNNLQEGEVKSKSSPTDLVTIADQEAEEELERLLPKHLPGSLVIGEEGIAQNRHDVAALQDTHGPVWVVDPVDGTRNFTNGSDHFGTMVALAQSGETLAAWIYMPRTGEMIYALKGEGAYLNGQRLNSPMPADNIGRAYVSRRFLPPDRRKAVQEKLDAYGLPKKKALNLFCAAREYANIAIGAADFSIYWRLNPWDHLPGALILREAGGEARHWDGSVYDVRSIGNGMVNARSRRIWDDAYQGLVAPFVD